MMKMGLALLALLLGTACNASPTDRAPIHAASASTTPLAMKSGSSLRNALSSFAVTHDLELIVSQEIEFDEGADATILLGEKRSGCGQFDIAIIGAASLSHRARILMYPSRVPDCRGAYDVDMVWNSLLSVLEMSPDLRNIEEDLGKLEATPSLQ